MIIKRIMLYKIMQTIFIALCVLLNILCEFYYILISVLLYILCEFYYKLISVLSHILCEFYYKLIQKTYQFIKVVNGVSRSHKTANIFFYLIL